MSLAEALARLDAVPHGTDAGTGKPPADRDACQPRTPTAKVTTLLLQVHNPVALAWIRAQDRRFIKLSADPQSRLHLAQRAPPPPTHTHA
jgi:hypothetical protein